ncbi:MAG TPA: threonine/serine exporter family protein [Chitinophagaceae bacterium]|nr:threonine/serine exporter family protein [Chitinophagaceae bacterium]
MNNIHTVEPAELGKLLLQAGIALLNAGAGSNRIITNLNRLAAAFGYDANIDLSTKNISLSLHTELQENIFSGTRSMSSQPGSNFRVISAISRLSWDVSTKKLGLAETLSELEKAVNADEYQRWVILLVVGLAGASFCYTFGGNVIEMGITFLGTVSGLFIKQELIKKKFNIYVVTYCSAVISALVIGIGWKVGINPMVDHAFATCTLFLIPGVPLINSVIDLMDGYIINGIDRGINASIHAFGIAAGLATILYTFNFHG